MRQGSEQSLTKGLSINDLSQTLQVFGSLGFGGALSLLACLLRQ
jgi:hypothetical protein